MDKNTIGLMVGIVKHTFSITNDKNDKVQCTVGIDFRSSTDTDIKTWLTSNRVIGGQRPWRALTKEELLKNVDGKTFIAQNIGQKIKSREEQHASIKATFMNAGVPEAKADALATTALDSPELLEIRTPAPDND